MKDNRISISPPHYNESVSKYVEAAFTKNEISNYGENIDAFEPTLIPKKEVVVLNSGTSAIHLALIQLGITHGDEVICQTFTFCGSANPIMYQGVKPVFVDSELDTWNMCPNHLEDAIKDRVSKGKKPKAIILVHLYGMPAQVDEILEVAEKYQIPLIEDAAEALGSSYKGRKCGTFGDYSILSFNGNKIITTSGGGALICNTKEQKKETIFYATQARDNAPHYQHSKVGYNYRMSNISAGIGIGQMEVLDKHIGLRQKMNVFYKNLFKNISGVRVFQESNNDRISNHWLSCITIEQGAKINRQSLQKAMLDANIETRPLWKPMHLQPVFLNSAYYGNDESQQLFLKGLCLPSGSNLSEQDRNRISETVIKLVEES